MCDQSKKEQDVTLAALVPRAKRALEALTYAVKAMLSAHDLGAAFACRQEPALVARPVVPVALAGAVTSLSASTSLVVRKPRPDAADKTPSKLPTSN
jgi:hypothetical protein